MEVKVRGKMDVEVVEEGRYRDIEEAEVYIMIRK